ncbi:hypothetical protein BJX65DRAFT_303575 [Aspergillus insuetus]
MCLERWNLKVIPPIPRDSAFRPTLLRLWTRTALLYLGAVYQFSLWHHAAYCPQPNRCKGTRELKPLTWIIHAYDLVSWAWWWTTFAIFSAAPDRAGLPFTPATGQSRPVDDLPADNRISLYADAPFGATTSIANAYVLIVMSILSILAGSPIFTSVGQLFVDRPHKPFRASRRELARRLREGFNFFDLGIDKWLAISSVLVIIVGGLAPGNIIKVYREPADAAFNVDWVCHAVHVSLSQWRFNLDAGKPWRLAQSWFGA